MHNKKAISLMVSYTLLVIIAIGLSVVVYGFLKLYLPSDQPECPQDINLAMEDVDCDLGTNKLNITLSNRGLFNVSGAFIRVGPADKTVRTQVNKDDEFFSQPLSPNGPLLNTLFTLDGSLPLTADDSNVIEIQPAILIDNKFLVPCTEAVVNYPLTCT